MTRFPSTGTFPAHDLPAGLEAREDVRLALQGGFAIEEVRWMLDLPEPASDEAAVGGTGGAARSSGEDQTVD